MASDIGTLQAPVAVKVEEASEAASHDPLLSQPTLKFGEPEAPMEEKSSDEEMEAEDASGHHPKEKENVQQDQQPLTRAHVEQALEAKAAAVMKMSLDSGNARKEQLKARAAKLQEKEEQKEKNKQEKELQKSQKEAAKAAKRKAKEEKKAQKTKGRPRKQTEEAAQAKKRVRSAIPAAESQEAAGSSLKGAKRGKHPAPAEAVVDEALKHEMKAGLVKYKDQGYDKSKETLHKGKFQKCQVVCYWTRDACGIKVAKDDGSWTQVAYYAKMGHMILAIMAAAKMSASIDEKGSAWLDSPAGQLFD